MNDKLLVDHLLIGDCAFDCLFPCLVQLLPNRSVSLAVADKQLLVCDILQIDRKVAVLQAKIAVAVADLEVLQLVARKIESERRIHRLHVLEPHKPQVLQLPEIRQRGLEHLEVHILLEEKRNKLQKRRRKLQVLLQQKAILQHKFLHVWELLRNQRQREDLRRQRAAVQVELEDFVAALAARELLGALNGCLVEALKHQVGVAAS